MVHNQHFSPYKIDSVKSQYPDTVVPAIKKAPPLEGGNSMKTIGM